jgi:PelA/Pel-15E family pectate lyase
MTGIMDLFLDIINREGQYNWIPQDVREQIQISFNKALSVTLQCQIVVNRQKTAWCQQHNNTTLKPAKARSYELASITSKESTYIILFLMRLDNPGDSVIIAIESAMKWLSDSRILGYSYEKVKIPTVKYHETTVDFDRVFIADTTAKPVWARYYNIETNIPFLCNRNGIVVYNLSEIEFERRVGYGWYGYWPEEAFQAYPLWHENIFGK